MSESESQLSAAAALREAAANLIAKADQLEASIAAVEDAPTQAVAEPLAPATSDDEAKARLVALDLATQGVDRSTAFESLTTQFPDVDVAPLIDRFFRA